MLYESIEHADITVVRFENKVCFGKLKVMLGELPDSWEAARALKKCREEHETQCRDALAACCVLYNRTEHSQGFSICKSICNPKMFVIKSGINPKFCQTTNCIGLTSEFFARDIREDHIALKIKTMLHDLYL